MSLFHSGKKKEGSTHLPCAFHDASDAIRSEEKTQSDKLASIKVLGTGCKFCHEQYENVKTAIQNMERCVEVEYITDLQKIVAYGIMTFPAIVANDKVVSAGKILKVTEVERLLHRLGY